MHVLIIGASGVVGKLLCRNLRHRTSWQFRLAGRTLSKLQAVAAEFNPAAAIETCDVANRASLDALLEKTRPDIVVNLAGSYTTTAMTVAHACLHARIMLFDICDEPKAMVALRGLHEAAVAAGVPFVIGGGTAPQTSCALLRQVLQATSGPVSLNMGYVLGMNRYGPNAVQTVSRGVSGLMSHDQPTDLWTVGPLMPFPAPFGPLRIRKYPVPESVLLENWPGVETWFAGARLSFGFLNAYVRLLQSLHMVSWGVARFWNSLVAAGCRGAYQWKLGSPGIAIAIEARQATKTVVGQLYHPEMSELTAHALALSLDQFARQSPPPGVWWGHEVIDPPIFLHQLEDRGVVWKILSHESA